MSSEKSVETDSPQATFEFGKDLGKSMQGGEVIGLSGDLGAGKTCLVQGITAGLAVPNEVRVTSPTFTLINEYRGGRLKFWHADLYRVEQEIDLQEIGLAEYFDAGGCVAVEWWERFPNYISPTLTVNISVLDETRRRIVIARP